VGGSTSGSATIAATGPLSLERVRASHHARGVPSISRIRVVTAASCRLKLIAAQSAALKPMLTSSKIHRTQRHIAIYITLFKRYLKLTLYFSASKEKIDPTPFDVWRGQIALFVSSGEHSIK
jgi:hypothetical protein